MKQPSYFRRQLIITWHTIRYRTYFGRLIFTETSADRIKWLDFPSGELTRDEKGRVKISSVLSSKKILNNRLKIEC
jgi:hypothetical protein